MKKIFTFLFFVLTSELAGILGGFFTRNSVRDWYVVLNKPSFNPPSWVFGPVWTTLYFMMGTSAFLVYQKSENNSLAKTSLIIFFIHLFFNMTWSLAFFGLKSPFLAFINIIILLIFIVVLIFLFYKIDKTASFLLIPYLLWVSFATILNFSIWRLN